MSEWEEWEKHLIEIVDLLAKEYGWTIEYIQSLDLSEVFLLLQQIKIRKQRELGKPIVEKEEYFGEEALKVGKNLGIIK